MQDINAGLNEQEIRMRDQIIQEAMSEFRGFDQKYSLGFPLPQIENLLTPRHLDFVKPETREEFGLNWLEGRIEHAKSRVVSHAVKNVLSQINSISFTDDILRGSSSAIACKLTAKYFFNETYWSREYCQRSEYELDFSFEKDGFPMNVLHLKFYDIADKVCDEYEKQYMRYRLWGEEEIDLLCRYLFKNHEGFDFEDRPCGYLLEMDAPVSLAKFIVEVDGAISELPMINLTEMEYPDSGDSRYKGNPSCIFSEYSPLAHADENLLQRAYSYYLNLYESWHVTSKTSE